MKPLSELQDGQTDMNYCGNGESIHGKSGIVNYTICEVLNERYALTWIMPHQDIVEDAKKELARCINYSTCKPKLYSTFS